MYGSRGRDRSSSIVQTALTYVLVATPKGLIFKNTVREIPSQAPLDTMERFPYNLEF